MQGPNVDLDSFLQLWHLGRLETQRQLKRNRRRKWMKTSHSSRPEGERWSSSLPRTHHHQHSRDIRSIWVNRATRAASATAVDPQNATDFRVGFNGP